MLSIVFMFAFLAPVAAAGNIPLPEGVPVTVTADSQVTVGAGPETFYIVTLDNNAGVEVWRENGSCTGLQRSATWNGQKVCQPDTRIFPTA